MDGAFRKGTGGAGGIVVIGGDGEWVSAEGRYFGGLVKSNNESEMQALLEGIEIVGALTGEGARKS